MWDKPDWTRYSNNIDDIETNSDYSEDDKEFLRIEWKKQFVVDRDLHLNAQKRFLGLLRNALQEHQEINMRMESMFGQVSPLDFMQGSRALLMLRRVIRTMIQGEIPKIQSSALGLGDYLLSEVDISYDGLCSKIAEIQKAVETITNGSDDFGETERLLVQQFVNEGRSHSSPAVAAAMLDVHKKGTFTLEALERTVRKLVPPDPPKDGAKAYLAKAMSTVASYLGKRDQGDQKVQAFMTLVSSESRDSSQDSSQKQGRKRTFTAEEQQKYIKKLQEQNRELRAQVKSSRLEGTDSFPLPGGRGRGGRGRGRGGGKERGAGSGIVNSAESDDKHSSTVSQSPAQASAVESVEIKPASSEVMQFMAFCAETGVDCSLASSSDTPSDQEFDSAREATVPVPGSVLSHSEGKVVEDFSPITPSSTFPTTRQICVAVFLLGDVFAALVPAEASLVTCSTSVVSFTSAGVLGALSLLGVRGKNAMTPGVFLLFLVES